MEQQETKIAKKDLIRKKTGYPGMEIHKSGEVEYLTFPALERLNIVTHMVTSRLGGVSTGDCASFNFSYARDTSREAVDENFRRAAGVFGTTSDAFVCSDQTHTTNIRRVEKEDAGKGVTKEKDYRDVDGLITNVPGLILGTFYADCVPLLFVDPVHHAIGCSHSGWRGTVGEMGKKTVEAMREAYGSCPEDIFAAIGPSICQPLRSTNRPSAVVLLYNMKLLPGVVVYRLLRAGKGAAVVEPACRKNCKALGRARQHCRDFGQ